MDRSCFLLGYIRIVAEGSCSSDSYHIFLEWKQHDLGVVKSGDIGIIFLVRRQADVIKGI